MAHASVVHVGAVTFRLPTGEAIRRRVRRALFTPVPRRWELQYLMWLNSREYQKKKALLKAKRASHDDHQSLIADYSFEFDELNEEFQVLETRRLRKKAHRKWLDDLIPDTPEWEDDPTVVDDPNWAFSPYQGAWYMRAPLKRKIRDAVRVERESRYKEPRQWATLILAFLAALASIFNAVHHVK